MWGLSFGEFLCFCQLVGRICKMRENEGAGAKKKGTGAEKAYRSTSILRSTRVHVTATCDTSNAICSRRPKTIVRINTTPAKVMIKISWLKSTLTFADHDFSDIDFVRHWLMLTLINTDIDFCILVSRLLFIMTFSCTDFFDHVMTFYYIDFCLSWLPYHDFQILVSWLFFIMTLEY